MIYYLGLGSNLGRRQANLARARRLLEKEGVAVLAASSIYETEPVDYAEQPWFLNQVLKVRSALEPPALLRLAKSVEAAMKRRPAVLKGPRTIDIDILLAGSLVYETPGLVIPHPRLHLRNFVLAPLTEIAPRLRHPGLGRTVAALARASADPGRVERLAGPRSPRSRARAGGKKHASGRV
ncbi:MAG TPA: 2-amino-4-hydroxy-6-hydroxymethyldihydropteridine diphosphokinase [Acidobacteriota bacterium]|nr:2-amino-4-hydroxy-6-hydroxymethyldihydropteridine diphosphokinase [Acidobacteriota bacterium]